MKKDIFLETSHVTALRNAVTSALEAGRGHPAMVMTYGEAGTGKTVAAQSLYVEFGGFYLRAFEGMTLSAFLQDLCFEVDGSRPHGSNRCRRRLLEKLEDEPAGIFVDEADRLHVSCLEALRDIHDMSGSPVIFIGEMGLPTRVNARSRISDRIPESYRIHFDAITRPDVALFASESANLDLTMEAVSFVHTQTRGNFRRVHNAVLSLENAAKAKGTGDIDAEFARAVLGNKKKKENA